VYLTLLYSYPGRNSGFDQVADFALTRKKSGRSGTTSVTGNAVPVRLALMNPEATAIQQLVL
jgi:hypothetical protein